MTQLGAVAFGINLKIELEATLSCLIGRLKSHGLDDADIETIVGIYKKNDNKALIKYGKQMALLGAYREEFFSGDVQPETEDEPLDKRTLFKQKLIAQGKTITSWAKEQGFEYRVVVQVLNGMNKGKRGEAHRVAVAIGLKVGQ
jgi:gp16 family phage-associated protein